MSKTASSNPALPGQSLTYTIRVINAGPDDAADVALTDPLPSSTTYVSCSTSVGTCAGPSVGSTGTVTAALGTLAVGDVVTLEIVVRVASGYGNLVNTATVTSSTPDPDPGNNTSTAVTTINSGIPTLTPPWLGLLALLLAAAGLGFIRRE